MRRIVTFLLMAVGVALMVMSYFFLAAPWGFPPRTEEFSNPVVPGASGIFILGFLILFLAAVAYEILPEKWGK